MDSSMIIEIIGYIGSALIVASMLMTSVIKLRVVNTVGACFFVVYALLIHSYPTALMNACLAIINIHKIIHLPGNEQNFTEDSPLLLTRDSKNVASVCTRKTVSQEK